MDYDPTESTWSGNQKFRSLLSDDGTQYTEINWLWDSEGNKWEPSAKSFSIYNSRDMVIYQEHYLYEPALGTFYMSGKGGYDFQGDTLRVYLFHARMSTFIIKKTGYHRPHTLY